MTQNFDQTPARFGDDVSFNPSHELEPDNIWHKQLSEIAQDRSVTQNFLSSSVDIAEKFDENKDGFLDMGEIATGLNRPDLIGKDRGVLSSIAYAGDQLKELSDDENFFESKVSISDLEKFTEQKEIRDDLATKTAPARDLLLENFDEIDKPDIWGNKDGHLSLEEVGNYRNSAGLDSQTFRSFDGLLSNFDYFRRGQKPDNGPEPPGLRKEALQDFTPNNYKKIFETIGQFDALNQEQRLNAYISDHREPVAKATLMDAIDRQMPFNDVSKMAAKELASAFIAGDLQSFERLVNHWKDNPNFNSAIEGLNQAFAAMGGSARLGSLEDGSLALFPQDWNIWNFYDRYHRGIEQPLLDAGPFRDELAVVFGADGKTRLRPASIQDTTKTAIIMPGEVVDGDPSRLFTELSAMLQDAGTSSFEIDALQRGESARAYFDERAHVRDELLRLGLKGWSL